MKRQKRIKAWVNMNSGGSPVGVSLDRETQRHKAADARAAGFSWRTSQLIELRRGEVIVNVEELVRVLSEPNDWRYVRRDPETVVRAALKKVGVR